MASRLSVVKEVLGLPVSDAELLEEHDEHFFIMRLTRQVNPLPVKMTLLKLRSQRQTLATALTVATERSRRPGSGRPELCICEWCRSGPQQKNNSP